MRLDAEAAERGILAGDRGVLARAITLLESTLARDQHEAEALLARLAPRTGRGIRLGVSGPPGVGKSTFIEALGCHLIEAGRRVAVLAVDPSSQKSGGSILGDKTRMPRLALDPRAFVRPSPAGDHLGGVAGRTREAMLLLEAFGFDVVLIETVGVGQSETEVATMVDCFLLLALAAAGDELQGIKRGIMELCDIVAVNKADGELLPRARVAARDLSAALRLMQRRHAAWGPQAVLVSALTGSGVAELWQLVLAQRTALEESGALDELRREQARQALWAELGRVALATLRGHPAVTAALARYEDDVARGAITPIGAARALLALSRA